MIAAPFRTMAALPFFILPIADIFCSVVGRAEDATPHGFASPTSFEEENPLPLTL